MHPVARRRMNMNVLLMLLVCSMAALCIHARININLRVGWFGQLTSLTGIYICLLALQPLLSGKNLYVVHASPSYGGCLFYGRSTLSPWWCILSK